MTKKEIYEQVVRLTTELAQTKVAEKIFNAATEGDAVKTQTIIDAFPIFYPELNQKIISFGKEFNKLIGESEEDNRRYEKICENCQNMMYYLAETKVISQIAKAVETGEPTKVQEVIDTFKKEYPYFANNLLKFQEKFTNFYNNVNKTGYEGSIFGTNADEENDIFKFDANVIDVLSFYVLTIFAKTNDVHFFCGFDNDPTSIDDFVEAIENVTNEAFGEFVANYNLLDWVGENEEYKTVGELLVDALADEFEDEVEEEDEEDE